MTSVNFFAEVYIDSGLVGLVGTASTSNFPVVYDQCDPITTQKTEESKTKIVLWPGGYFTNMKNICFYRFFHIFCYDCYQQNAKNYNSNF